MPTLSRTALCLVAFSLAGSALAAERTVTLEVQNVSCVTCAPIVKRTLSRQPGVSRVAVTEHGGSATATVTFDDARVTPEALTMATINSGFPSKLREN